MTVILWLTNFVLETIMAAGLGYGIEWRRSGLRLISNALCILISLGFHFSLRDRDLTGRGLFFRSCLMAMPISLGLSAFSELLWLRFDDFYAARYGFTWAQFIAGQCGKTSGCASFFGEIIFSSMATFWIFVAWSALYVSFKTAVELRDRDSRIAVAEAAAQKAKLTALQYQLNPHFLFNTMNTLSGLIALDRKNQAEDLVMNISNYLRRLLGGEPLQMISLSQEVASEKMYLDIERARFAHRLDVKVAVEPNCLNAAVPAFLLQPLVENSIKHAVTPAESVVQITIAAKREDDRILIRVEDSGAKNSGQSEMPGFGIGIENVRMRLEAVYGDRASLSATARKDGAWVNELDLPWIEYESDDSRPDR
jgi:signal transduction histidine kinase